MKAKQYSVSDLRRINRNRVYRYLYGAAEPQTAQEIEWVLQMSLPTVNQNLNELIELGLIDNSKIANSTGGRKPRVISIIPAARYAVGVEISPHHIRMVAVDLVVNQLGYQDVGRQFEVSDEYSQMLAQDITVFIQKLGLERDKILGIGITLPGIVHTEQALLEYSPPLNISQLDLSFLACHIPFPVRYHNDANAGAFAEWWQQTDLTSMAYLSLGRGIGGAILINGVPYQGVHRRSGEFGHMCIRQGGRTCSCGKKGCLEAYCSTALLSDNLNITLDEFFDALDAGDTDKARIWDSYLADLALGIVNIHAVLDCDIVLGGVLSQYLKDHVKELEEQIRKIALVPNAFEHFHLCRYNGRSNSIGAALLFVDAFLASI